MSYSGDESGKEAGPSNRRRRIASGSEKSFSGRSGMFFFFFTFRQGVDCYRRIIFLYRQCRDLRPNLVHLLVRGRDLDPDLVPGRVLDLVLAQDPVRDRDQDRVLRPDRDQDRHPRADRDRRVRVPSRLGLGPDLPDLDRNLLDPPSQVHVILVLGRSRLVLPNRDRGHPALVRNPRALKHLAQTKHAFGVVLSPAVVAICPFLAENLKTFNEYKFCL